MALLLMEQICENRLLILSLQPGSSIDVDRQAKRQRVKVLNVSCILPSQLNHPTNQE